jgi:nitroreductase
MDVYEAVKSKLDVREFSTEPVPDSIKLKVIEAARLTQSGNNSQHWRFILLDEKGELEQLANDSLYGKWVKGANFAVIVLTDPTLNFHKIDAGRAVQSMQLTAWNYGVASGVFVGVKDQEIRRDFSIPTNLAPTITVGFGYPIRKILGRKSRKPLSELAFHHRFGNPLELDNAR